MAQSTSDQALLKRYYLDIKPKKIPDKKDIYEMFLLHLEEDCPLSGYGTRLIGMFKGPNMALHDLVEGKKMPAHYCPHCFPNIFKVDSRYDLLKKMMDDFIEESSTTYYIEKKLTPNTHYEILNKIYTQKGSDAWKEQVSRDGVSHLIHKNNCKDLVIEECDDLGNPKGCWNIISKAYEIYNLTIGDEQKGVRFCPKCCEKELKEIKYE